MTVKDPNCKKNSLASSNVYFKEMMMMMMYILKCRLSYSTVYLLNRKGNPRIDPFFLSKRAMKRSSMEEFYGDPQVKSVSV